LRKARNEHLVGQRVKLIFCSDPYTRLTAGEQGTVDSVDDWGTVFVQWDNGSSLGLVEEAGDRFEIVAG
jgi:hypothetical protein